MRRRRLQTEIPYGTLPKRRQNNIRKTKATLSQVLFTLLQYFFYVSKQRFYNSQ